MIEKRLIGGLAVIFLIVAVFFYALLQQKATIDNLRKDLEELNVKYQAAKTEADESRSKIQQLNTTLQDSEIQIKTLTADLNKAKQEKQQVQNEVSSVRSELSTKLVNAESLLQSTQEKIKKMEMVLKKIEEKNNELKKKVTQYEENANKVELGKIVVNTPAQVSDVSSPSVDAAVKVEKIETPQANKPSVTSGLEGKITVVNKEYDFVVINLGDKDGIKPADVFTVFHNNKSIGEVRVEKVQESISAASFTSKETKDKISVGDRVAQKV